MAGFFFAIYFIFGHEGESYATIGNSMITTFLKFFGAPKYDEMAEISESMAIIIIIFFGIICFLIILKLFTAIVMSLSLIHISEPTRPLYISYAVFCLKKKKK
eukprot:TRINITY_DN20821_c0_g1_i1.p2 TRINITY_DN20821_c0_g1~~TRINITY_DN20821_c0_g1_i1.p2  ORF type:complete len:103 (-),score=26.89 TRINITY_DN20821_c0_g1_i1:7-315(-)